MMETQTNRIIKSHVLGRGKRRFELPNFKLLDEVSQSVVDELIEFSKQYSDNDLHSEDYAIAKDCPLMDSTYPDYRQIMLQKCASDQDKLKEQSYTAWTAEAKKLQLYSYIQENFPQAYRTRISILPPETKLDWHIDTDTSVSCRAQIALCGDHNQFEVKRRGVLAIQNFQARQVWFCNTGWTHRVHNQGKQDRINIIFGIDYEHIAARF